jgi:hypothetical protein
VSPASGQTHRDYLRRLGFADDADGDFVRDLGPA